MKATHLELDGLKLVELDVHGDERGFFVERFHHSKFAELELPLQFFQVNHSRSAPNVLRGLHYQHNPGQGKLVGVTKGRIWDVAVDVRRSSPTYGQHFGVELSDINGLLLWIPSGFAHGFCVLDYQPTDVMYFVDAPYTPENEGGILWDDPHLQIPWPITSPLISQRDQQLTPWQKFQSPFD